MILAFKLICMVRGDRDDRWAKPAVVILSFSYTSKDFRGRELRCDKPQSVTLLPNSRIVRLCNGSDDQCANSSS